MSRDVIFVLMFVKYCFLPLHKSKENFIEQFPANRSEIHFPLTTVPVFFLLSPLWQFFHSRTEQRGGNGTDAKPWTVGVKR